MKRAQSPNIIKDLNKKMVFIVGPRQSGKTWLAKNIARNFTETAYLNYDQIKDRKIIENQEWLPSLDLLILDELHKMPNWKNFIKGVFDTKNEKMRILVTGSARLDIFDLMGDSLAGRYFRPLLLPFSLKEIYDNQENSDIDRESIMQRLLERGGFPEPYLEDNIIDAERWRQQYLGSLLATDVFEFDKIQNIKALQLIVKLLQTKVSSCVSYQSLAEDVQVSVTTVKKYIEILEALFIVFRITPFSKNIARSLLKEPKIYFYDIGLVPDKGARFENLVALSLLKHAAAKKDYLSIDCKIHYLRTKDGHEVDFAIIENDEVTEMVEAKLSESSLTKSAHYFIKKYNWKMVQCVHHLRQESQRENGKINILKASHYLSTLYS